MNLSRVVGGHPWLVAAAFSAVILGAYALSGPDAALVATGGLCATLGLAARETGREALRAHEEAEWSREMLQEVRAENVALRGAVHEDPRTGVGNWRQLQVSWGKAVARYHRRQEPFGLVVVNLPAGESEAERDEMALAVLTALIASARGEDSVCSIGPRRFAALLAGTGREGAGQFVARLRGHLGTRLAAVPSAGEAGGLTIGIGVWGEGMETVEELIAAAEADARAGRVAA